MKPSLAQCLWMLLALGLPVQAAAPVQRDAAARRATVPAEDQRNARVIVKFRAEGSLMRETLLAAGSGREATLQHAARLSQRLGLALRDGHAIAPRTQVLHARGMRSSELVARLQADPDVEYAEVDHRMRISAAPNDPRYAGGQGGGVTPTVGQWYLRAPDSTIVAAINAEAAWDVTTGSSTLVVAVLDTGVRPDHPDLVGKLLPGYDFVSEDGTNDFSTANDGNGRDAIPTDPGDWITPAEDAAGVFAGCGNGPSSWHGTQTAGLIGAATNNGVGMAGVGRNVMILPVRVLGKCGGFSSDVAAAMYWAAGLAVPTGQLGGPVPANNNPARVINLSLGSDNPCSQLYRDAFNAVTAAGVTVVVAAGNDIGHSVNQPANCPGAIAVAGLRHSGSKVGYSNIGPEVSIAAPAGNCGDLGGAACLYPLLTTTNSGTTAPVANTYSDSFDASLGTSFSAPLVAGTAALMLSANPAMTPSQLRSTLMSTARAFPTTGGTAGTPFCVAPTGADQIECYCTTSTCGAGMLNASAAVAQAAGMATLTAQAAATPANPTPGTTVTLSASNSVAPAGRTITGYQWAIVSGGTIASIDGASNAVTASVLTSAIGSFVARLTVTDNTGASASADLTVVVADAAPPAQGGGGGGGGALTLGWVLGLLAAVMVLARTQR